MIEAAAGAAGEVAQVTMEQTSIINASIGCPGKYCSISRLFIDDILFEWQQPASSNARATVTKYSGAFMSQLIV